MRSIRGTATGGENPRLSNDWALPGARPFVKWAGGKGALVESIARTFAISDVHRRYIEPFLGAGALFFHLQSLHPRLAFRIADSNDELVNAYRSVRDDVDDLIAHLEEHQARHSSDYYYETRASSPDSACARGARFIYLNRTCFNGLYRVNRKGQFNVPIGSYKNPAIAQPDRLLAASRALSKVEIEAGDFEDVLSDVGRGDLVYLDPPYDPLSQTSHFTGYTQKGFGREEQTRLASVFADLVARGATVVLSNSETPFIRELYEGLDIRPRIEILAVGRSINSKANRRGPVHELMISHLSGNGAR